MIGLNYVTRRGAIYVWRKRLPAWVSRTMYLQISLRTANGLRVWPYSIECCCTLSPT